MKLVLTYHQKLLFGSLYLLILVCALLDTRYQFQIVRAPFQFFLKPWQVLEIKLNEYAGIPIQFVKTVASSQRTIADLQIKNAQLQVQVAQAQSAQKENETLKKELEKKSASSLSEYDSILTARVVSVGTFSYVDKGAHDGVSEYSLITSQDVLLGKVKKCDRFFSSVVTLAQGSWQTVAMTQNGMKGIVTGKNNRVLFTQVAADQKLEVGDQIFTSGSVGENIPVGLYIGQITEKIEDVGAPLQTAVVDQGVSIESTPIILIKTRE